MKISIIIPVYNTGELIHKAVDSITSQPYEDWEIVIVDDGSEKSTAEICDKLALGNDKIKVIHTPNTGAYQARLTGVSHSSGERIMFVDSDDCITPECLTGLTRHIDGDYDIIVGTLKLNSRKIYRHKAFGQQSSREYIKALILSHTTIGPIAKLYKRNLFDSLIQPDIRITNNEDLMLLIQLARKSQKIFIDKDLICYDYIFRPGSAVSNVMPAEKWQYLFDYIHRLLAEEMTPELNSALQHMMLNRAYENMILRGLILTDEIPFVAELKRADPTSFSKEDRKILHLLTSPTLQRITFTKHDLTRRLKSTVKKLLPFFNRH